MTPAANLTQLFIRSARHGMGWMTTKHFLSPAMLTSGMNASGSGNRSDNV